MQRVNTGREIGTVREVARWTQEDGWPISESTIRRWIAEDAIKHLKTGNRFLVPYGPFCEYLGVKRVPRS